MPLCEIDLRVGGKYRYEWEEKGRDKTMSISGVFAEISAPARLRSVEKFDDDWTGGEAHVSQRFDEQGGGTRLTLTVRYASKQARYGAAASGMTDGMEQGYARLDEILNGIR